MRRKTKQESPPPSSSESEFETRGVAIAGQQQHFQNNHHNQHQTGVRPNYARLLEEIYNYQIGQYRGPLGVDSKNLPKEQISIGVFGYSGSGKSSLINTLIRSYNDSDHLEFFADPADVNFRHGTLNYRRFELKGSPNGIDIYDSRGLNFLDLSEEGEAEQILRFIVGLGSQGYIPRKVKEDQKLKPEQQWLLDRYQFDFRNNTTTNPLNVAIFVVPCDATQAMITNIGEFIHALHSIQYNSVIVVITKLDLGLAENHRKLSAAEAITYFSTKLAMPEHRVFAIENYRDQYHPRQPEKIDRVAVEILLEGLRIAERTCDFKWDWKSAGLVNAKEFLQRNWIRIVSVLVVLILFVVFILSKNRLELFFHDHNKLGQFPMSTSNQGGKMPTID